MAGSASASVSGSEANQEAADEQFDCAERLANDSGRNGLGSSDQNEWPKGADADADRKYDCPQIGFAIELVEVFDFAVVRTMPQLIAGWWKCRRLFQRENRAAVLSVQSKSPIATRAKVA